MATAKKSGRKVCTDQVVKILIQLSLAGFTQLYFTSTCTAQQPVEQLAAVEHTLAPGDIAQQY